MEPRTDGIEMPLPDGLGDVAESEVPAKPRTKEEEDQRIQWILDAPPTATDLRLQAALKAAKAAKRRRPDPARLVRWLLSFEKKRLDKQPDTYRKLATRRFVPDGTRPLTTGELEDVQRKVRAGLDALRRGDHWEIEPYDKQKAILLSPPRGRAARGSGGAMLLWLPTRWPWERFLLTAMQALDAIGDRLRRCRQDDCLDMFVARKGQELCEPHAAALQKARLAKITEWRQANPKTVNAAARARRKRLRRERNTP